MPLTVPQRQILQYLNSHQITPVDVLAETLIMEVHIAQTAIHALVDAGYVRDHRYLGSATVSITELGRRALRTALATIALGQRRSRGA
jgi:DNA-binding MarR family transcriptional regulator